MANESNPLDQILQLLRTFEAENESIQGSAVVSVQGLPICSNLGGTEDQAGVTSAMVAAILSVSERAGQELGRGSLRRVLLEGDEGLIIMQQAGPHAILVVLIENDRQIGLIFLLMKALAKRISGILE